MISFEQALRTVMDAVSPLGETVVQLDGAHGRVLAEAVRADRDFPPTDRSAMDGFAVRAEDLGPTGGRLEVAGEVRAGQPVGKQVVEPGTAVRIFTGAVIPPGADSVVMVEDTVEETGAIRVETAVVEGQHIRVRGQDRQRGATVLLPGHRLLAPELAVLSAVGHTRVGVHRSPRVQLLSTGDEVVEPQDPVAEHQVRNSNATTLRGQLRELGLAADYLGNAGDSEAALEDRLARGLDGDLLIVTGGVSVGDYDLVATTLTRLGVETLFHRVAMKPGKPVLVGRRGSCLVAGLPGNPLSVFTGFVVLVAPALRKMMGLRDPVRPTVRARLTAPLRNKPGRRTFHLAELAVEAASWVARPVPSTGSGDVLALAGANGFIVTGAEQGSIEAGAEVEALPWGEWVERRHPRPGED